MAQVLIVDDQEQNLYLLQVMLHARGYEVRSARNGIEALEIARREAPDLIITDILMPGMDGFSLCRAWMADEKLRGVPLVFYTATYTDTQDEALPSAWARRVSSSSRPSRKPSSRRCARCWPITKTGCWLRRTSQFRPTITIRSTARP